MKSAFISNSLCVSEFIGVFLFIYLFISNLMQKPLELHAICTRGGASPNLDAIKEMSFATVVLKFRDEISHTNFWKRFIQMLNMIEGLFGFGGQMITVV